MRGLETAALLAFIACGSPTALPTDGGSDVVIDNVVSGGNPDAGDAASFDTSTLPGLVLWFDATRGLATDGGAIASWADQSKSAIVLTATVHPQGALALDPTGMNGHPAVTFSGPVDFYDPEQPPINALTWSDDDLLLEAVVKADGSPRILNLYENNRSTVDFALDFSSGAPTATSDSSGSPFVITGPSPVIGPHVIAFQRKNALFTLDLRVDGVIVATMAAGTSYSFAPTMFELGFGLSAAGDAASIAEIILVHGTTSDANRDALEAHLRARYGL